MALPVALLLATACAQTFDATTLGVPASMASAAATADSGAAFTVSTHSMFALWGLFSVKQPSVEKALAGQLVGGKRIEDVRIKVHSSATDVLLTILTAGIIVPRSVTVEGKVVGP
ncbi:MAG TPA: hypothetical protein VFK36_01095 [Gemmatimonadales bacterium]|nr:hypothetical protein [Gemmatimonadales bacterium]